jgi:hypothetical protein
MDRRATTVTRAAACARTASLLAVLWMVSAVVAATGAVAASHCRPADWTTHSRPQLDAHFYAIVAHGVSCTTVRRLLINHGAAKNFDGWRCRDTMQTIDARICSRGHASFYYRVSADGP